MDNSGGSEPRGKGTFEVCDYTTTTSTFTTKHVGKHLKFNVVSLHVTQKKFFTFWEAKFEMILPMLERLKQSSAFSLITVKVSTYLFIKEGRMYHRNVFVHTMLKIATKLLMIAKSLYLRNVKCISNLKKGKTFGNKYRKKKNIYFNYLQCIRFLAFI